MPRPLAALAWALWLVSILDAGLAVERHDPALLAVAMGSSLAAGAALARDWVGR